MSDKQTRMAMDGFVPRAGIETHGYQPRMAAPNAPNPQGGHVPTTGSGGSSTPPNQGSGGSKGK